MREPVVTATAAAIEHLQIVGQIKAAPRHEADDHDHHPRATARVDQHRERRHAFHEIERESAEKMKPIARQPISIVARTRFSSFGNMLDMSRPVPYSAVVPVDIPPMIAIRHTGRKNQFGDIASRPPT